MRSGGAIHDGEALFNRGQFVWNLASEQPLPRLRPIVAHPQRTIDVSVAVGQYEEVRVPHDLRVSVSGEFTEDFIQSVVIVVASVANAPPTGSGAPSRSGPFSFK
jgi:hypothetical protein